MQTYIVQKGDTLYGISKQFGVSVNSIISNNNIVDNKIYVGEKLIISLGNNYYIVKKGDTLYSISKKYGVSVDDLIKANNLVSTNLSIGSKLIISTSDNNSSFNPDIYVVKSGDTLYSISKRFGISVNDLVSINKLSNTSLFIGQTLIIGKSNSSDIHIGDSCYGEGYVPVSYVLYTVKSGDNLYSISKRYGVSVDSIVKLNNLNSLVLNIGQVLKIKEK